MYWIVFIIISICTFLEIYNKKIYFKSFYFVYSLLSLMTILRKGQGSDYYNYKEIYGEVAALTKDSIVPIFLMKDPGYSFFNYLAIHFGLSYEIFSSLCSLIVMVVFFRFFSKICNKSMLPLFFFYTTFYLIYPFSGIRQGFTIAILLSYVYPLLNQCKYTKCTLLILFTSLFHQSFLVCLLFLLVYKLKMRTGVLFFLLIPFVLNLLLSVNIFEVIRIPYFSDRVMVYMDEGSSSPILSIIVRIIVLLPVFFISDRIYKENSELRGLRNILICGFIIYSLFSFNDLTSSRLAVYSRVFEGLFLFLLIYRTNLKIINYQLVVYYSFISFVLFTKDINSFIEQGKYENCNIITYPYLTVFHSDDTIMYYRKNLGSADRMDFN